MVGQACGAKHIVESGEDHLEAPAGSVHEVLQLHGHRAVVVASRRVVVKEAVSFVQEQQDAARALLCQPLIDVLDQPIWTDTRC